VPDWFNNQRLFSDYYLAEVVPTLPEWSIASREAAAAQAELLALWARSSSLVVGNEAQTEQHWIKPVLGRLGMVFQVQTAVPDASGVTRWPDYALFATEAARAAAEADAGTPGYFSAAVGVADAKVWGASLDRGTSAGALTDRRNPNYQIDAYLRETDRRWGLLTNGRKWRLYCRDTSYRLDSFYEVDLIELLNADPGDFTYFWAFFRLAAFENQPESFLDRVREESETYAERLSTRVKARVYGALKEFVNGFFAYTRNGLDPEQNLDEVYEASLILLYRILFALYGEAHELLPVRDQAYRDGYSFDRIKKDLALALDENRTLLPTADNYFADLVNLFTIIADGAPELGVPAYNGGLFSVDKHPFLANNRIGDEHLARGLDLLARVPASGAGLAYVDYKTLQIRHLGDIYEGLLEYHPRRATEDMVAVRRGRQEVWKPLSDRQPRESPIDTAEAGTVYLATGRGERRATGSYYTPQEVVARMVEDSVGRLIAEREESLSGDELVDALLALKICDPALGSGHFLVEVVDFLARAIVRAGASQTMGATPDESELQAAKRLVVERCVYGVDPNPLAVELAKLSLWLATVAKDRPLSFVDAHLLVGNSLIGTTIEDMAVLKGRAGTQMNFVEEALARVLPLLLQKIEDISERGSDTIGDVVEKERLFAEVNELRASFVGAADLWTARHFGVPVGEDHYLATITSLMDPDSSGSRGEIAEQARAVALRFRFHHWQLAFPDVFLNPSRPMGFDAVVTNPPYVNAIERRASYTEHEARFWRNRFDAATGAFDLYVLFLELGPKLVRDGGFASLITPNKFLAAPYAKGVRKHLSGHHALLRLIDGSRVQIFEDPMVYPVITLFKGHRRGDYNVEVQRFISIDSVVQHASHPSSALTLLPESLWAFLLLDDADLLLAIAQRHAELEGHLGVSAGASTAAAEADAYGPELREEQLATKPGWRIVATGTITPFAGEWGVERLSHQRHQFLRPVLPFQSPAVSNMRRDQYWAVKLIFKKLCLRLSAVLDTEGQYASMNTNFVFPGQIEPFALAALFHSSLLTWIYEGYFGALRMGGGYMQVQAPQLRVLPIPNLPPLDADALEAVVAADTFATLDTAHDALAGASQQHRYAALRVVGKAWHDASSHRLTARGDLAAGLLDDLALGVRRDREPAFVIPRQEAILDAIEDPAAVDLSAFWTPFRLTARALRVEMTTAREVGVLTRVQRARPGLVDAVETIRVAQSHADNLAYALFDLDEHEIARVSRGHNPARGSVVEAD
jgi:type I restriction-modification system DNA methylase subunit